jgi:hypothetical protein
MRVGAATAMLAVLLMLAPAVTLAFPTSPIKFPVGPVKVADFTPTGTLVHGGSQVQVSGPLTCWKGGTVRLLATISEHSTRTQPGGIAQGTWKKRCTGTLQHWRLIATTSNGTTLRAGCAQADGLIVYRHSGATVDIKQWLQRISLISSSTARYVTPC